MPAALAFASSVSNSVKLNVPGSGSIVPHGMFSSAVVRPSDASPAKNDSDQAVPPLSKSSWVDQIGVVGDAAARATGAWKPQETTASRAAATGGTSRRGRRPWCHDVDAHPLTLMSRSSLSRRRGNAGPPR